ncbi:MAG TPA: hypothetical protein PK530_12155 [Anaerolineales bacterium]|nr:hypothetical protein [Anaerolineales bacterium]
MIKKSLTLEQVLYLFILFLALAVRLTGAGHLPLSDAEADPAMRALQLARGESTGLGTQPGYVLLTGLVFFLMGSGELTARIWPILAGTALVFLPFLLRERLGQKAALVIALGLALDPGLVALSQTAGGPMMAVCFLLLAGTAWVSGGAIAAGILLGLAWLSGPVVVAGAVGLLSTVGLIRALGLFHTEETEGEEKGEQPGRSAVRSALLAAGGTLLLAGVVFLRYPQGVSALGAALPAYLAGWSAPSGVPVSRLLVALVAYPFPAILFGLIALFRGWISQDENASNSRALSLWLVIALIFAFAYPGRQVSDLAWALVPLWGLAGLEVSRYLYMKSRDVVPWALTGLVVIMMLSVWVNLAGLAASNAEGQMLMLRWLVVGGAILLAILSSVLVGLGWTPEIALRGLVWGTTISLCLGMLASIWGNSERQMATAEALWRVVPGAGEEGLALQTLDKLSDWTTGRPDSLNIVSLVDTPSVRWALRNMPNVRFQTSLSRDDLPEAIITYQDQAELSLGSAYRGQDFVWWVYPNWDGWTGMEWLKWLTFHEGTVGVQNLIVWGRGDLFPSGEAISEQTVIPEIDLTGEDSNFVPEEEVLDQGEPMK